MRLQTTSDEVCAKYVFKSEVVIMQLHILWKSESHAQIKIRLLYFNLKNIQQIRTEK